MKVENDGIMMSGGKKWWAVLN